MSLRLLDRQRKSFDSLVDSGIYSTDFDHAPKAKEFVADVLQRVRPRLNETLPLKVLDCGCGTGAWLSFLHGQLLQAGVTVQRICGYDLSERMIDVAHEKLRDVADAADIRQGNALEGQSYVFPGLGGGFDLVFTYDVVQQLPRRRQMEACRNIIGALAPGGVALIFDNDAETPFGRRMARRKFFTRYFGLPLVPRYYCNASYPPLERFRQRIESEAGMRAEIVVRGDKVKRALIVQRRSETVAPDEGHSEGREA